MRESLVGNLELISYRTLSYGIFLWSSGTFAEGTVGLASTR